MTGKIKRALGAQLLLAAYFQMIVWVDLHPWNDLRTAKEMMGEAALASTLTGSVLNVLPLVLFMVGIKRGKRGLQATSFAWYMLFFLVQLNSQFGSERETAAQLAADTLQLLPGVDAQHAVLLLLYAAVLAALASMLWGAEASRSRSAAK